MPDSNREVYEHGDVVRSYVQYQQLTKGERLLFTRYAADFKEARVLDIGVGGGRTTPALAEGADEYWGIDYSRAMVEACQKRFAGSDHIRFIQDDARSLAHCPDAYFDAAVFSFNGIDVVNMEGRKAVLSSVLRILKPGGSFIFSFHNTGYLDNLYSYHWQKNPFRWWQNYQRYQRLLALNGPKELFEGRPFYFLKDGGEDFKLDICYMQPAYQRDMLTASGFQLTDIVASQSGVSLTVAQADISTEPWLYFRCTKI